MKRKTWFHYLPWAGNGVKYPADEILSLENQKLEIITKLHSLDAEIAEREKELLERVQNEWSPDEISQAKSIYRAHGYLELQEMENQMSDKYN